MYSEPYMLAPPLLGSGVSTGVCTADRTLWPQGNNVEFRQPSLLEFRANGKQPQTSDQTLHFHPLTWGSGLRLMFIFVVVLHGLV